MADDIVIHTESGVDGITTHKMTAEGATRHGSAAAARAALVAILDADPDFSDVSEFDSATLPSTEDYGNAVIDLTPGTPPTLAVNMPRARIAFRDRVDRAQAPRSQRYGFWAANSASVAAAGNLADLNLIYDAALDVEGTPTDGYGGTGDEKFTTGTSNPTVNDDSSAGYVKRSKMENTSNGTIWQCTDPTVGAAVWKPIFSPASAALAGLTPAAGKFPVFTGSAAANAETITAAGLALLDDASATAQVSTLGLKAGTETLDLDGLTVGGGTLTHTLNGTSITSAIEAHSEGGSDLGALTIHRHDGPAAFGAHIVALRSNGTHASPTVAANGDHLLRVIAAGFDGTDYAMGGEVRFIVSGTPGSDDMPTDIVFLTSADGSHAPAEAMRVTSAGNVTFANPSTVLDTAGAVRQGLHTIPVNAAAMWPRTTTGCAALATLEMGTNKGNFPYLAFDSSTAEYAQFIVSFPKSWNNGAVTARVRWAHPSTTTNFGVVWKLSGVAISDDDALDVAQGTAQSMTDTGGTTSDLYVSPTSSAITIGGTPATGDSVLFEISRAPADGSDTMAVDAYLIGVDLFYTINASTDA